MVWVLRRPTEIAQVICIPVAGEFSVGRIDCSFNITDDKSVSRRHAILFQDLGRRGCLILADQNSKFGTFVNGEKVESSRQLSSGDAIKFGGAGSEFVVETRDLSVFVKSSELKAQLKPLADKFGFQLIETSASDSAYYIPSVSDEKGLLLDSSLMEALLESKPVVSPAYHLQLQAESNAFSLGLVHPTVDPPSKLFALNSWLPRKDRRSVLKDAFEGVRRFVYPRSSQEGPAIESIARAVGIETRVVEDASGITFNEVIINCDDCGDYSEFVTPSNCDGPVRVVTYRSMIEAILRCDASLLDMETIICNKDKPMEERANVSSSKAIEVPKNEIIQSCDYEGPSLTAVIPIPSNFLRPALPTASLSDSSAPHRPKFVKCYPKHRQPGTIPALIGPDQLNPIVANSATPSTAQSAKRYLIKDAWLAEDDSGNEVMSEDEAASGRKKSNVVAVKAVDKQNLKNPLIAKENTKVVAVVDDHKMPFTATTTGSSKFQSSFFKNLSKKT